MTRVRVLIADDDPHIRSALAELFEDEAWIELVGQAADADQAIHLARDRRPDVVILDVKMPGGGGPHATREIVAGNGRTHILALSASDDRATVLEMLRAGASGYLVKGTPVEEILDAIRNAAGGNASPSQAIAGAIVHELGRKLRIEEQAAKEREEIEHRVRQMLHDEAFVMHFQPIVQLATGRIVGVEALARFADDRTPDRWFADAAIVGLAEDLEIAAVRRALTVLDQLDPGFHVAVNVSPRTLITAGFHALLDGISPDRLVMEVTEHAIVEDYDALGSALAELRAAGARLAVDDAGAGYASLRHILRLRPELIKLDIALTRDIDTDPVKRALGLALVSFSNEVGAQIIAEGIETQAELNAITRLGITYGQGYFLARPAPELPSSFTLQLASVPG